MLSLFLKPYRKKRTLGFLLSTSLTLITTSSCVYHDPGQNKKLDEALASSEKNLEIEDFTLYPKAQPELPLGERLGITQEIPIPEIELSPDEILTLAEAQEARGLKEQDFSLNLQQYETYPKVQKWIKYFNTRGRRHFQKYLDRGHYFKPIFSKLLRQQGLPGELYYMALIESGFRSSAVSSASAVGIWQFISATAKRYGLRIDSHIDERKDPIRATLAASSYLSDLKNVFDSWFLAMAAYNSGESRIMNLIIRYKTRNYWVLSEQRMFPKETANYVPKMIAAYLIGQNLEKYNFKKPDGKQMPELISISLPSPIKINDIAIRLGISVNSIKKNNPHLNSNITPTYLDTYRLWFEKTHTHDHMITKLDDITVLPRKTVGPGYYLIRPGDTLGRIAKKFGLSVKTLKLMNRMRSNTIISGKKLLVSSTIRHEANDGSGFFRYTVRRGDSLFSLAKKYGTSIRQLKKINALKSSRIYIGQKIRIGKT